MTPKKKIVLILIISLLAVVIVGTTSVTLAWFLSRYTAEYEFKLEANRFVVINYESDIAFASGTQATSVLTPAEALFGEVAMDQSAVTGLDVFDVTKVETAANYIAFTSTGAFWTGESTENAALGFDLEAHIKETAESAQFANYDLVAEGDIGYVVIIEYKNQNNNYHYLYDGTDYYVVDAEYSGEDTLGATLAVQFGDKTWKKITTSFVDFNGTAIVLRPNTVFRYDLYVYMAKTDEELNPSFNGKALTLKATISEKAISTSEE